MPIYPGCIEEVTEFHSAPISGSTLRLDRRVSAKTLDADPHRPKDLGKYSYTEAQGTQRKKKTKGFRQGFQTFKIQMAVGLGNFFHHQLYPLQFFYKHLAYFHIQVLLSS